MKDPRNTTLGELLDSTDQVIYRNAMSIHKRLRDLEPRFCVHCDQTSRMVISRGIHYCKNCGEVQ